MTVELAAQLRFGAAAISRHTPPSSNGASCFSPHCVPPGPSSPRVAVTGHTHVFSAYEAEGKLYINPGSATGAFSPTFALEKSPTPSVRAPPPRVRKAVSAARATVARSRRLDLSRSLSLTLISHGCWRRARQFVLMDVQSTRIVVYVYELFGDEVKVKKIEHQKAPVQVA